jgi:glycopeptide antibiotics resistance protein
MNRVARKAELGSGHGGKAARGSVASMSRRRAFFVTVLSLYLIALAAATLSPHGSDSDTSARLIPLVDTWRLIAEGEGEPLPLAAMLGNVALFVPLGWLLPSVWPPLRDIRRIVVLGAACSMAIEVSQLLLVPGRTPSVDDVIFNALGALIGAAVFLGSRKDP